MELPKLPTDNLYKFQALSCLIASIIFYGTILYLLIFYDANNTSTIDKNKIVVEDTICARQLHRVNLEIKNFRKHYWADSSLSPPYTSIDSAYFTNAFFISAGDNLMCMKTKATPVLGRLNYNFNKFSFAIYSLL